jgi:hypothetical protein
MRAARLSSSLIERIAYDEAERVLKIRFRDGPLYCYFDVPPEAYRALKDSPSPGRIGAQHMLGRVARRLEAADIGRRRCRGDDQTCLLRPGFERAPEGRLRPRRRGW